MGVTKFAFISTFCANISAITSCWADGGQLFFLFVCFFLHMSHFTNKSLQITSQRTHDMYILDYGPFMCGSEGIWFCPLCWKLSADSSLKLQLQQPCFILVLAASQCSSLSKRAYFCCLSQPPLYMSHCFLLWLSQNQWNVNATLHVLHTTMTWSHHFFRSKATCLTEGKQNIYFGHYSLTHIYSPVNNSSFFVFFFFIIILCYIFFSLYLARWSLEIL